MDIVFALLQYYGFDLGDYSIAELTELWCKYDPAWVRLAIIEALYRGRYKAVSVDQILASWQRRGEPYCLFTREFERLVCGGFTPLMPSLPRKVTYASNRTATPQDRRSQTESTQSTQTKSPKLFSPTHQTAMQQMGLLADSSLFVDKLKAMCQESVYVLEYPDLESLETQDSRSEITNLF
ncbi:hypothetical protein [Pseudanabaena sp. PCC 6802]|uniref:hypothetical protein n=1 Tax=Pseudanabaena sp. PCC 6802 TaxID=118173 RepID=UPI00034CD985|nr:hypothetical protein [Pseudanabaena sp. PCC 6802]